MKLAWVRQSGSSGALGFAALGIVVLSGVALAIPFNALKAYDSVAVLLLTNPGARFLRNVHYWSAQLLIVLLVVHTWRHVGRASTGSVPAGLWARTALLLPLVGFLMLSGFILKGDAEALQALRIVRASVGLVPFGGQLLSLALFGADPESLQVLYVHHIATATLVTWLLVSAHARAIWPRLSAVVPVAGLSVLVALVAAPALHDGLNPIVKGPWYFVGLQEIFHHATRPGLVAAAVMLGLATVMALPKLPMMAGRHVKAGFLALLLVYSGVTLVALFSRGQNWSLRRPTVAAAAGLQFESPLRVPPLAVIRTRAVPVVLGRREGCLFCHAGTTGLSPSHQPDAVGCSSCHLGNPFSLDKTIAHRGLVLIPGNLDTAARTCGGNCHPAIVERVNRSIMTSMRGVIAVDRSTFGEAHGDAAPTPAALGDSPADTHLRQLCASCHLGVPKRELGPIGEQSRGGGCNACHLVYSQFASRWLSEYKRDKHALSSAGGGRMVHPDLSVRVSNDHCFGCHSRSGRVSTSYEGWGEASRETPPPRDRATRALADGRVFLREQPDVHFEKGMLCVDCHTSREVMGDGREHDRKHGQLSIACEDCHAARLLTARHNRADDESRRILNVLGRFQPKASAVVTRRNGEMLTATVMDGRGRPALKAKRSGVTMDLKQPADTCVAGGAHERLSCISCHSAWSSRCSSCHTAFDPETPAFDHVLEREVRGSWAETAGGFEAAPPTLGIRIVKDPSGKRREVIDPFVPGMVLTVKGADLAGRADPTTFRRLYARTFPHTVSARGRSCVSCHNDPVAVGYGSGALRYTRTPRGGRWTFVPASSPSPFDGLASDAWIGFLERPGGSRSTREDVRPFDLDEQKRLLTAGACLTCHRADSRVMREGLVDFASVVRRTGPQCVVPAWLAEVTEGK